MADPERDVQATVIAVGGKGPQIGDLIQRVAFTSTPARAAAKMIKIATDLGKGVLDHLDSARPERRLHAGHSQFAFDQAEHSIRPMKGDLGVG
jgi:hypothetical protein